MRTLLLLLLGSAALNVAYAGQPDSGSFSDYANVSRVSPIYANVAKRAPQRECWTETVRYQPQARRHARKTPKLLGTLVGAAIGHNVARTKDGQKVGRIAGALLGNAIAGDAERASRYVGPVEYRDEERCEVRQVTYYEQAVVGYDVTYEYQGRVYTTRMDEDPGSTIKVMVDVRPLY